MQHKLIILIAATLGLGSAAPQALAGHDDYRDGGGHYQLARVVEVQPLYRSVRINHPQRECWDDDYLVRHDRRGDNARRRRVYRE